MWERFRVVEQKVFGSVRKELDWLKKNLAKAETEAMASGNNHRIRQLKREIEVLLEREAIIWAQRSRVLWARQGDRNTKYFHSCAARRYRKNMIEGIRDEEDRWRNQPNDISIVLVNYYKNLFTSTDHIKPQDVLSCVPTIIDDEMNAALSKEFDEKEVKEALHQMAPLKAPGPDGMHPLFYQHFWGTVRKDVTTSILAWLNSSTLPSSLNHTFITLIPKTNKLEYAYQFRPISLCNVLYKIYSKVLANRLKKLLPSIITEHQSTFTKDRLISDKILVAFETLHSLQNFKSNTHGFMAIKSDMSKAYDQVDWGFLEKLMRQMGFNERWIQLIMGCVKTVSYLVLVNGEPCGMIQPTCGIRQGDPLSPFLFLLCTKGLNGLIKRAENNAEIHTM